MNKETKIAVYVMLFIIVGYIVVMSVKSNLPVNEEINNSGDIMSGEISSDDDMEYRIEKISDNEIGLIAASENMEILTKYIFENDMVAKVYVIQEVFSGDFVKDIYETMMLDNEISLIYNDIRLEGNVITMELKQDYVNIYNGVTYDELYEDLNKSLNLSEW